VGAAWAGYSTAISTDHDTIASYPGVFTEVEDRHAGTGRELVALALAEVPYTDDFRPDDGVRGDRGRRERELARLADPRATARAREADAGAGSAATCRPTTARSQTTTRTRAARTLPNRHRLQQQNGPEYVAARALWSGSAAHTCTNIGNATDTSETALASFSPGANNTDYTDYFSHAAGD
jgi:hypothetical protein